jgi:anaerobic magnesium-protoporphyrin IX monomethyl ester cyclase
MKILLINPPIKNIIESDMPKELESGMDFLPPLGLMYIAAYVKEKTNFDIKLLDCEVEKINYTNIQEKIKEEKPDVVGITTMTFTLIDVIKTAKLIKEVDPNIKIVLGGPHVNIYPEETMNNKEIDFLVLGEGEQPFIDLLGHINDLNALHDIRGLVFRDNDGKVVNTGKRELIMDLDSLPTPARELTPYKKYYSIIAHQNPTTTMFTSRGCPYKCIFCDRPHLGKIFRARSAEDVVKEMEEIEKMGIKEVFIYDDTFTIDRQRVVDICNLILDKQLQLKWDIRARVNTVDEELLILMKSAGCTRIHYGVEAGTKKILTVLRKGITLEQVETAFKLTKKAGIETAGYFMIGSPTETMADIKETIKLAKRMFPDFVHFTVLTPFPATDLYFKGLNENIIKEDYWQKFSKNPQPDFKPPIWDENFTRDELFKILIDAYGQYYLNPKYILRRLKELRSWSALKNNIKAGFKLLSVIIKNTSSEKQKPA